jgi:hypothetical protein
MKPDLFERAILDPESVFETPDDVLADESLTNDQKIEILRLWEYDACEEAVALEEGMPGDESGLERRILRALSRLVETIDVEHTGPAKQHGLAREAITAPKEMKS